MAVIIWNYNGTILYSLYFLLTFGCLFILYSKTRNVVVVLIKKILFLIMSVYSFTDILVALYFNFAMK